MAERPPITLLTGPAACGKNTIAHIYATQYRQACAAIDVDLLRWMLRQPHLAPWPSDPPDSPAQAQHRLGIKHACLLAQSFVAEGYETVICDVVGDRLAAYYRELLAAHDFKIVLLLPTWEASLARLRSRGPTITEAEARLLYDQQQSLIDYDARLDNTTLSADQATEWLAYLRST
jgi:hypothetical protein